MCALRVCLATSSLPGPRAAPVRSEAKIHASGPSGTFRILKEIDLGQLLWLSVYFPVHSLCWQFCFHKRRFSKTSWRLPVGAPGHEKGPLDTGQTPARPRVHWLQMLPGSSPQFTHLQDGGDGDYFTGSWEGIKELRRQNCQHLPRLRIHVPQVG